ncbi:MAG: EFR1 family ferrodoxin [Clostridia bacterium]|nr:EFR1 family ferrodoxin [Clostridia bacterium]
MKIGIYVFSATGNTARVCKLFQERLLQGGAEVAWHNIEDSYSEDVAPDKYDTLILAYPVHGFNAPTIVTEFAKKLPKLKGKGYYIVKSSGEPAKANRASSAQLNGILKSKGYDMLDEFHYVMPYNMIFRHDQYMVNKMWSRALEAADIDAARILEGKRGEIKQHIRHRFISKVFRIEHGGMRIIGRHYKVDTDKCVKCMKCVKACPMGNIKYENGKFVFGKKCLGCARCSFNCPVDAFNISLLNGWKVNGAYDFSLKEQPDGKLCKWCNKSYKRYFSQKGSNSIENQ